MAEPLRGVNGILLFAGAGTPPLAPEHGADVLQTAAKRAGGGLLPLSEGAVRAGVAVAVGALVWTCPGERLWKAFAAQEGER